MNVTDQAQRRAKERRITGERRPGWPIERVVPVAEKKKAVR